jgi:hypothetical protein
MIMATKRRMAMATKRKRVKTRTQFQRLRDAGVLTDARVFTPDEKKVINQMPRQEVDMLIRMRKQHGPAPRFDVRPNVIL